MKHGNFWMTTIGAGVVIAGMMSAGRAAMQTPAFLFLAGQIKVATGQTEAGMRLMNEAASQHDSGTVHAAEPAQKPTQVCTKDTTRNIQVRPAAERQVKTVANEAKAPVVVVAKLEVPPTPAAAMIPSGVYISPVAFQYMSDSDRRRIAETQIELQKVQRERMKQVRRAAHAMMLKYPVPPQGFNPTDMSFNQHDLPSSLGQLAQ